MSFFRLLLFLTPLVCIIRMHWITIIMILMFISLVPILIKLLKNQYDSSDNYIKIVHPISQNILTCISVLIAYQFLSFLWFDFEEYYFHIALKKIMLVILHIFLGISILYAIVNDKNQGNHNENLKILAKGLIFACIIFLLDHLLHHKIFSLFMPHLVINNLIGYNISQSHMGQIFCTVIIWPIAANFLIIQKQKYAIFLIFITGIIAILPFAFHGFNYNAVLSFFIGLFVFIIFKNSRKYVTSLSIVGFAIMILCVPALFTFFDNEAISSIPDIKLSITHRICIWHYYAQKVYDTTLIGYGFNASETFGAIENVTCSMVFPYKNIPEFTTLVANGHHPHNIGLQALLELGLIGFIIIIVLGILIIIQSNVEHGFIVRKYTIAILSRQNKIRAAILASFFAFMSFLIAAVNVWASWVIATIFIITIISQMVILNARHQVNL